MEISACIPVGYRFAPTDEELIFHYLYNKVHGKPLSAKAVMECDLYGDDEEPWRRMFDKSGENTHYFFTVLRKKKEGGSRIDRRTGSGTWHRIQTDEPIYHCDGRGRRRIIGSKRTFKFKAKNGLRGRGRWTMQEYRLHGCLFKKEHENLVLCRVTEEVPKENEDVGTTTEETPNVFMEHSGSLDNQADLRKPLEDEGVSSSTTIAASPNFEEYYGYFEMLGQKDVNASTVLETNNMLMNDEGFVDWLMGL